ncbi:MAG: imidazolonepropionase [Aggregatilineales bacterium]
MKQVDLILKNAAQIVTCANKSQPKRGQDMLDAGIIKYASMAIQDGVIVAIGADDSISAEFTANEIVDATGKAVIPGLVDCHTHTPYAGNRYDEFEMRVRGQAYMDILNAGGGIMSTVGATRATSSEQLLSLTEKRLLDMHKSGTTTVEMKTGYGLSTEAELMQMQTILAADASQSMTIVPTFLGAHTRPPEFETTADYIQLLITETLPLIHELYTQSLTDTPLFVDIFVEEGVFSVDDMVTYFEAAGKYGIHCKAHLDQFENLNGVRIAVEMGATSVDHLEATPPDELDILAQSNTVGVMLPTVNFNLGLPVAGNARHLVDSDGILALSTDYNPGSSPTISLPLVMAIACRYQKLLPAEALNACTINAAAALKLEHRIGSLEAGKQADFVILNTDDYRSMIIEFGKNFVSDVYIKGEKL